MSRWCDHSRVISRDRWRASGLGPSPAEEIERAVEPAVQLDSVKLDSRPAAELDGEWHPVLAAGRCRRPRRGRRVGQRQRRTRLARSRNISTAADRVGSSTVPGDGVGSGPSRKVCSAASPSGSRLVTSICRARAGCVQCLRPRPLPRLGRCSRIVEEQARSGFVHQRAAQAARTSPRLTVRADRVGQRERHRRRVGDWGEQQHRRGVDPVGDLRRDSGLSHPAGPDHGGPAGSRRAADAPPRPPRHGRTAASRVGPATPQPWSLHRYRQWPSRLRSTPEKGPVLSPRPDDGDDVAGGSQRRHGCSRSQPVVLHVEQHCPLPQRILADGGRGPRKDRLRLTGRDRGGDQRVVRVAAQGLGLLHWAEAANAASSENSASAGPRHRLSASSRCPCTTARSLRRSALATPNSVRAIAISSSSPRRSRR